MMFRLFLARPHPLISHLCRHDRRFVARLGGHADQIISRSYTSDEDETESDVDLPEATNRRKHLYLVLDDWKRGFSIHKLDLDDGSDGGDLTLQAPVHRQEADYPLWNFASVGTKIVAVGRIKSKEEDYVKLVYDAETTGLSIVPHLPEALRRCWYLSTAAENGLYTFEYNSKANELPNGNMHHLEEKPTGAHWWLTKEHWSWNSIPTLLPFHGRDVESSAVHPEGGGRTLFVSVAEWNKIVDKKDNIGDNRETLISRVITHNGSIRKSRTFSYDTGAGEWSRHVDWDLLFYGHASYNAELDVWVGLQKMYKPHYRKMDGYLCSCDVPPSDASPMQPEWKLCGERLFDPDTWNHIDASLVYMSGSNYCLIEVIACGIFNVRQCAGGGNKCVIRIATFRLKYGKNGELIVTAHRPDRSYSFSRFLDYPEVRAFWM